MCEKCEKKTRSIVLLGEFAGENLKKDLARERELFTFRIHAEGWKKRHPLAARHGITARFLMEKACEFVGETYRESAAFLEHALGPRSTVSLIDAMLRGAAKSGVPQDVTTPAEELPEAKPDPNCNVCNGTGVWKGTGKVKGNVCVSNRCSAIPHKRPNTDMPCPDPNWGFHTSYKTVDSSGTYYTARDCKTCGALWILK